MCAVDRLEEALQSALTYLLFHEGEEFMTDNVEHYREVLGHDGKPREVSDIQGVRSLFKRCRGT